MKVGVDLRKVRSHPRACKKRNCNTHSYRLNRHHKGHQFMFVSAFVRTRMRESKYRAFVDRYYEFHPDDIVDVCESHHAEVHEIYDKIIQRDLRRTGRPLRSYTWIMAEALMERLITRCNQWLDEETPGSRHSINSRKRKSQGGFQAAVRTLQQKRKQK